MLGFSMFWYLSRSIHTHKYVWGGYYERTFRKLEIQVQFCAASSSFHSTSQFRSNNTWAHIYWPAWRRTRLACKRRRIRRHNKRQGERFSASAAACFIFFFRTGFPLLEIRLAIVIWKCNESKIISILEL